MSQGTEATVMLLPCPGCTGPAFYVDTVLCDHCSFEAKTPEDWNRRAGQSHADAALLAALEAKNARLLELVSDFIFDDDPCFHDHHGYCQAHGWFCTDPCPHKRARAAIAAAKGGRDAG